MYLHDEVLRNQGLGLLSLIPYPQHQALQQGQGCADYCDQRDNCVV